MFQISKNGTIATRVKIDLESLDSWNQPVYHLEVYATDGERIAKSDMEILIKDNTNEFRPRFLETNKTVEIPEVRKNFQKLLTVVQLKYALRLLGHALRPLGHALRLLGHALRLLGHALSLLGHALRPLGQVF